MQKAKIRACIILGVLMIINGSCNQSVEKMSASDSSEDSRSSNSPTAEPPDSSKLKSGNVPYENKVLVAPDFAYALEYNYSANIKAIFFDSVDYKGEKTKVFAYIGFPAGASSAKKVPGVVLVHGGGGTAYPAWVKKWNDNGYAAIAIDTEGNVPSNPLAPLSSGRQKHP